MRKMGINAKKVHFELFSEIFMVEKVLTFMFFFWLLYTIFSISSHFLGDFSN